VQDFFYAKRFLCRDILIGNAMDDLELRSYMGQSVEIFVLSTSIWKTSVAGMVEGDRESKPRSLRSTL